MLARIVAEFGHSLPSLEWMDEKTKQKTRKKLDALGHKIGFPENFSGHQAIRRVLFKSKYQKTYYYRLFFITRLGEQNIPLFQKDKL